MSRRLEDLLPRVAAAAARAIADLKARGVPVVVTSTLRTLEEQKALYAQGRKSLEEVNELRKVAGLYRLVASENSYTVTNADGVKHKSNHQSGKALDAVPEQGGNPVWPPASDIRWKQIAGVFQQHGFAWGGEWKDLPDLPHYEYKGEA